MLSLSDGVCARMLVAICRDGVMVKMPTPVLKGRSPFEVRFIAAKMGFRKVSGISHTSALKGFANKI